MFAFSLLLLVLMVHDSHGETCSCDGKIESLRKEVSRIASENKIMKSQLSDFQRIKNISGEIDEFRSMRKYLTLPTFNTFAFFLCFFYFYFCFLLE